MPKPKTKTSTVRMSKAIKAEIEKAAGEIERARIVTTESKQPRFSVSPKDFNKIFQSIYKFGAESIFREPKYISDSRKRDAWLAQAILQEPYLLGISQSVVSIDKNRGWTLIGGRNQVKRFVAILHNFGVAPDVFGWRNGISVTARSYYQSDLGGVVEIGRTIENGPLAALFTVDPTQCSLTGKLDTPLKYHAAKKEDNPLWTNNDYFRVASFLSSSEKLNGLGYCATSRCIELAKLLVSLFEHEKEKLGSKAPKGLLVINNLTQAQWLQSLSESDAGRTVLEREFYTGVQVLANGDGGKDITVSLTSLSELPDQFDRENFLNMIIYGYALAHGYDPREFWPVSSGSLGNNIETESQHRRATSKGGLDFALSFQEQLQEELPPTVQFEFEQRDVAGDLAETEFKQAQLNIIQGMFQAVNDSGENLITFDEARQLLVEAKLIPDNWTPDDEAQQVSDTDDAGIDELLDRQRVRSAMDKYPLEQIVEYNERTGKTRTIYDPNKKKFSIAPRFKIRQYSLGDYGNIRSEYINSIYEIVYSYLDSSDRATSYKAEMKRNIVDAYTPTVETGYMDAGAELPLESDVDDFLTAAQGAELANVDSLFVSLSQLRGEEGLDIADEANRRANGYSNTLDGLYNTAVMYGLGNKMLTFSGVDGEKSCDSCQSLQGQRHKASWWIAHEFIPPTGAGLDCAAGGHCAHILEDDDGNVWTE